MMAIISLNGRLMLERDALIAANDRGFTLGDGVFETIRVSGGRLLMLRSHLQRLQHGAYILELPLPSLANLADDMQRVVAANKLAEAVVRLNVSRGAGARGLTPTLGAAPTIMISAQPFAPYPARWYEQGVRAVVTDIVRNERSPLAGVKSLSYVEQVLARQAAQRCGADLGLMLNSKQQVVCGDCANLFVVQAGRLLTPPVGAGALPGITRQVLLAIAGGLGLEAAEAQLSRTDLLYADEILLTNVLLEVVPLVLLDGVPVGGGKPGPCTALLRRAYRLAAGIVPLHQ